MTQIHTASSYNPLQMDTEPYLPGQYDALTLIARNLQIIPPHGHAALRIVASLDEPLFAALDGGRIRACSGFILNQHMPYACSSAGDLNAVICCYSPAGRAGAALAARLGDRPYEILHEPLPRPDAPPGQEGPAFSQALQVYTDLLTRDYNMHYPEGLALFGTVFRYIRQHIGEQMMMTDICAEAPVPPGRIQQLFKECTGMSMTQYIAWEKLRAMLHTVPAGIAPRQLAMVTGYHNPAEAVRIFSRVLGLAAAELPAGALLTGF